MSEVLPFTYFFVMTRITLLQLCFCCLAKVYPSQGTTWNQTQTWHTKCTSPLTPLTAQPPIRGYFANPTPLIFLHIIFHHIVDDPLALSIPPSLKAKDIVKLLSKCVKCAVSDQFFQRSSSCDVSLFLVVKVSSLCTFGPLTLRPGSQMSLYLYMAHCWF